MGKNKELTSILFIGGGGFIGSSIIHRLDKTGEYDIHVVEPSLRFASRLSDLTVSMYEGQLGNIDLMRKIILDNHISVVVHLVSTIVPGSAYEDYKQEIHDIAFPTFRLTQLCSEIGVTFIYFSSGGTIYGNRTDTTPFKEEDKREPISYYGLTKLMIENNILFEHRTSGLNYLIVRPSNPYGPGQALNGKQGIIAVALGKIINGEPIEIWGDGSSVRDYIFIDDLADAVYGLINEEVVNTIVNIGSGKGYSVKRVLSEIERIVEEDVVVEYKPARSSDVSAMILDVNKLKSLVDFEVTPLKTGIQKFYNFVKSTRI